MRDVDLERAKKSIDGWHNDLEVHRDCVAQFCTALDDQRALIEMHCAWARKAFRKTLREHDLRWDALYKTTARQMLKREITSTDRCREVRLELTDDLELALGDIVDDRKASFDEKARIASEKALARANKVVELLGILASRLCAAGRRARVRVHDPGRLRDLGGRGGVRGAARRRETARAAAGGFGGGRRHRRRPGDGRQGPRHGEALHAAGVDRRRAAATHPRAAHGPVRGSQCQAAGFRRGTLRPRGAAAPGHRGGAAVAARRPDRRRASASSTSASGGTCERSGLG